MKHGISFPACQEGLIYPSPFLRSVDDFISIVQLAESLGYEAVLPNDHWTTQGYAMERGVPGITEHPRYFEPMMLLAWIAHATTRIRLGAGTVLVPLRDPLLVARQVITLDWISGGRAILSTGVGAYTDDFDAVHPNAPRPRPRGAMTDEGLKVIRLFLSEPKVTFEGQFWQYHDEELYPKPVQRHLPIYVAGNHLRVVQRAAELGDAWYPACLSPQQIRDRIVVLRQHLERLGRSVDEVQVLPQVFVCLGRTREEARERFHNSTFFRHLESIEGGLLDADGSLDRFEEGNLIGPPEYLVERLHEYREAGVENWAGQIFVADTVPELLGNLKVFAEKVMARF